ncbi:mitochondrial import inner membrane translocase subunit tim-54 [Plectosphaerella plurivora]|uniref:Mitochondrial import inner membrane translocase subunit TIM54 n=1 Tax=Plectosphaerella plurivora TaxID=936078 RepID=A0A9P9AHB1_9PEZI|nr:mitochondrial import inner membrane translocase subunit tim-54 [Plectosphaerella plurivora]
MSDPKPPVQPEPASAGTNPSTATNPPSSTQTPEAVAAAAAAAKYKAPERNPAFRMLGLPAMPKKLPSRNWTIFLTLTAAFSAGIIYDRREKKRATARWARAVAPLATEPIGEPSEMPRRLTVVLAAPPGEGLRVSQDHFLEYVKPILAASGLDWDFVQGRAEGDVRAAVAEKIRRRRRLVERPDEELLPTEENIRDAVRIKNGIPEYAGEAGDIVIGRNAWKEYVRGLHEGWLGPLDAPAVPEPAVSPAAEEASLTTPGPEGAASTSSDSTTPSEEAKEEPKKEEEEKKEEKKPERPPQPIPYNTTADYQAAHLPPTLPDTFSASVPVQYPHILGFLNTPTRMVRFFNRRALADDVGRQVAAACFAARREYQENLPTENDSEKPAIGVATGPYEQQRVLAHEEKNWVKSVWKADEPPAAPAEGTETPAPVVPKEKIWASPVVLDPRIASRMRRYELRPEDEARAREIVIPEEAIEGWIKGTARSVVRWGISSFQSKPTGPNVGNIDDEVV